MKICYLLVTCSREKTRQTMLEKVVSSLKNQDCWDNWEENFYVFDNDSTFQGSKDYLRSEFRKVFFAKENYGYWSAVNWFCRFALEKEYEYVYVLESDCIHYGIERLDDAIRLMNERPDIGMVRTADFSIENKHLYDKSKRYSNSHTCDWFVHFNVFTNEHARFIPTSVKSVFETNLVAKVCGLHRVSSLKDALSRLDGWFVEVDFQREYHELHSINAIMDGGIYNSSPAYEPNVIAGSLVKEKVDSNGYRKTREGFITPLEEMKVDFS